MSVSHNYYYVNSPLEVEQSGIFIPHYSGKNGILNHSSEDKTGHERSKIGLKLSKTGN